MSDEQIEHRFQDIRRQISALRNEGAANWEEIDAVLEDLHVTYEQMQTDLEKIEALEEEHLQQKQYYQNLFQFLPSASLVTDANGSILEANQAMAQLLNVPGSYLVGKLLAVFVAEGERAAFQSHLNQLSQSVGIQIWRMGLCPRDSEPVVAELHVAIARKTDGLIEHLRINVYNLSQSQDMDSVIARTSSAPLQQQHLDVVPTRLPMTQLPQSLDGLRVLMVDNEADIREAISAVLEAHGMEVRTVASVATALEELERFRPDVLLSDIRMPGEDGYSLIRQIRAQEAERGWHLPAAAMTAYLEEDREKSLSAGFEAHFYKMVQPSEWVEMLAQLARRA